MYSNMHKQEEEFSSNVLQPGDALCLVVETSRIYHCLIFYIQPGDAQYSIISLFEPN
jgi:hypothetical protein